MLNIHLAAGSRNDKLSIAKQLKDMFFAQS